MEKCLKLLEKWEKKFKKLGIDHFFKDDKGIDVWFRKTLENSGFSCIGAGLCAYVYKHPEEGLVIKYSNSSGEQCNFSWPWCEDEKIYSLPYIKVSKDTHCAIQEFVDCSPEAQQEAMKIINQTNPYNKHFKNMGMKDGKAVIIDIY